MIAKQTQIKDSSALQFPVRKLQVNCFFREVFLLIGDAFLEVEIPADQAPCNDLEADKLEKVFQGG